MESAFRTALTGAGVLATCYVLTAASWTQVLLLFLGASLGWCIYACRNGEQKAQQARRVRFSREMEVEECEPKPAPARVQQPTASPQPRHIVHRFPIHKLAST